MDKHRHGLSVVRPLVRSLREALRSAEATASRAAVGLELAQPDSAELAALRQQLMDAQV